MTAHPTEQPYDRFWNTRLRSGITETWGFNDPGYQLSAYAVINSLAVYKDGNYSLQMFVQDVDSDGPLTANEVSETALIHIDNFRPYVAQVTMITPTSVMYDGAWNWEPGYNNGAGQPQGRLKLAHNMVDNATTSGSVPITFDIYLSEPMNDVELLIPILR